MTNLEVIKSFLEWREGKTQTRVINDKNGTYKGNTLTSKNNKLYCYQTIIAEFVGINREGQKMLDIQANYFTNTTSKIQALIVRTAREIEDTKNEWYFDIAYIGTAKRIKWLSSQYLTQEELQQVKKFEKIMKG